MRGSRVVIVEDLEAPVINLPSIFFARVGEPFALDAWQFVQAGDVVRVVWYAGGEMRTSRLAEFTFQGESKQTLRLIAYDSEGNFGLDSAEPRTLEEIGEMLGITRERVRQIKERALVQLRHAGDVHALEAFLG